MPPNQKDFKNDLNGACFCYHKYDEEKSAAESEAPKASQLLYPAGAQNSMPYKALRGTGLQNGLLYPDQQCYQRGTLQMS